MLFTIIFLFILQVVKSSIVYDSSRQQGIHIDEYCPKMKYCAEGTHVMCMYYNPHKVHGPRCGDPKNATMLPTLAERLLELINAIRSKIARGAEKGKDNQLLPRGYGIFRLSWDKELATFAQVLANQCILSRDKCRATILTYYTGKSQRINIKGPYENVYLNFLFEKGQKRAEQERFPYPGQNIGLVRFTLSDWIPLAKTTNFSTNGLSEERLQYAANQVVKSWYFQKRDVDKEFIINYPDYITGNTNRADKVRNYLAMVYGPATHMGCGVSAYVDYAHDERSFGGKNYNSIQIICNISGKPQPGGAVYNTVPPGDTETLFSKCGCPNGSQGDNECLCINKETDMEPFGSDGKDCDDGSCDPTVVVLPIFTMEDTPPNHVINSFTNTSLARSIDIEDNNIFNRHEDNHQRSNNKKYYSNGQRRHINTLNGAAGRKSGVRKRNFDKKDIEPNHVDTRYSRQSQRTPSNHAQKKPSIFSRASRFSLPAARSNKHYVSSHPIKRDVIPRRDFTDAKKLVDKYIIYNHNNFLKPIARKYFPEHDIHNPENGNDLHEIIKPHSDEQVLHGDDLISHSTESSLSLIEQNVVHHDDFVKDLSKDSILNHYEPIHSIPATTDNKLMNLLDTLEKEVKHIELKDKDKELFDVKIRKIYGKLVGKPVEAIGLKLTIADKHESKSHQDDLEKHTTDNNRRVMNEHSDVSNKHELLKDKNDLSFELYDEPTVDNHHNVQRKVRDRSLYRNNDEDYRNKHSYRNIEHNDIESHEHKFEDFDFNFRKDPNKREHYSRKSLPRHDNRDDHKLNHKNFFLNHEGGDPLSTERRKYYQEKLDNIQRRLNRVRNHKRRTVTEDRHMRAMLTPHARKSENQIDSFYIPDRARFLHGY